MLGDLSRTNDARPEVFFAHKDALLVHLREFHDELQRYSPRLREAVLAVEASGLDGMIELAAEADERLFRTPRLLGMDEAFAGVDENGRNELMSLAAQFDLDLFMTGFDLWATHPTVPGCAHYDLSHSAVEHTVATVLIVWNGRSGEGVQTADFDGTLARALGSPATRRSPHQTVTVPAGPDLLTDEFDIEP